MSRSPSRASLGVLALATLVVLAGCTGGGAPYEATMPPEQVESNHVEALRDTGSFTYHSHLAADAAVIELSTNVTSQIDLESGARLTRVNSSSGSYALYVPPEGPAYRRVEAGDTVEYERVENESIPNESRYVRPPLANLTRSYTFTRNGTAQVGGEKTYVYQANASTLNESTVGPLAETLAELEDVQTTIRLYVRSDGLVKRVSYHAVATVAGEKVTLTYEVTYTDVGSTSVQQPSWLDEAKSVTDG